MTLAPKEQSCENNLSLPFQIEEYVPVTHKLALFSVFWGCHKFMAEEVVNLSVTKFELVSGRGGNRENLD